MHRVGIVKSSVGFGVKLTAFHFVLKITPSRQFYNLPYRPTPRLVPGGGDERREVAELRIRRFLRGFVLC